MSDQSAPPVDPGLGLVPGRSFVLAAPRIWCALQPGDRPLVSVGEPVLAGTPLAELIHDPRLVAVTALRQPGPGRPGDRWDGPGPARLGARRQVRLSGELLYEVARGPRIVTGEPGGVMEAPAAGIVREVRPGMGIRLQLAGQAVPGVTMVGAAARGRLHVAAPGEGRMRAAGLDVGNAGAILVVGARVDAETLIRARATGVRGIVVAAIASRDLRDFAASEARHRTSLHRLPPFAVLVLEGALRRSLPTPLVELLTALIGSEVAIAGDPPVLLFDMEPAEIPMPAPDWVRVRQGPWAGREGRWAGPAGIRRYRSGLRLEAGFVSFDEGPPAAFPLADLERFI